MSYIQRKLVSELAQQRQLDSYYLAAKNADFEYYDEADYLTILNIIHNQLERIELVINPSKETFKRLRGNIRIRLIKLGQIKPDFQHSKLKQWAIDFISTGEESEKTNHPCQDGEISHLFIKYDWNINILLPKVITFVKENLKHLSYYYINEITRRLASCIRDQSLSKEQKKQLDEYLILVSQSDKGIKKERDIDGANTGYALFNLRSFDHTIAMDQYLNFIREAVLKSKPKMDGKFVGISMYGIRYLKDTPAREKLLGALNTVIEKSNPGFDGLSVSNVLLGFRNIERTSVSEKLLRNLTKAIARSYPDVKGYHIGNALYGLQKFNQCEATEELLNVLADLIEKSKPEIDSKNFAIALFGLQNHSNSPATERILKSLTSAFKASKPSLNGRNLASGLYGLNKFYTSKVTDDLLTAVAKRIPEVCPTLNNKDIGMTLFGLQNFSTSNGAELFIDSIGDCLNYSKPEISDATVGSALMGLQNMTPSPACEKFLHKFTDLVYASKPKLSIHTITSALHGLINFKNTRYSQKMLSFIIDEFKTYKDAKLNQLDMLTLVQALNLWGVPVPEWLMSKYQKFLSGPKEIPNKTELNALDYINRNYPFIKVEINYYISGFECDLYLHGYAANIELDGFHHQNQKKRDAKRDRYIESVGCRVFRIDLMSNNLERKLQEILEKL